MNQGENALLLQDVEGYKEEIHLVGYGKQMKTVVVKKGSLLMHLNPSIINTMKKNHDCLVNYRVVGFQVGFRGDNSVKNTELVFATSDVLFYLSRLQRDLLLGVKNPYNRLELLGRLEWVESLRKGSEVYVIIPTITASVRGIVWYVGGLPGEEGRKFGVELMEKRGQGTHDGCFKETEFFKCGRNCAVFVGMDKLTDGDTVKAATVTTTKSVSTDRHGVSIRLGDHVIFYNKFNMEQKGIVRWIGTNKSFRQDGTTIVGIEAEAHINLNDVPHNINDQFIRDYFSSKKTKVFLPIVFVRRDKNSKDTVNKEEPAHDCKNEVPSNLESNNPYKLGVGSAVQYMDSNQHGVIKWIGALPGSTATCAGIEMEDDVMEDSNNGDFMGVRYFICKPGKGKFALLTTLKPDKRNEKLPASVQHDVFKFEVGHMVQFSNPPQYGTIKWIGNLPGQDGKYAGVETEDHVTDPTDGKWKGVVYFHSPAGKGKFIPLSQLQPDERFADHAAQVNPLEKYKTKIEYCVRPPSSLVPKEHTGLPKGIQGQYYSCYLDATLYGMFAFSDAFDGLFMMKINGQENQKLQKIMQENIVYPLRKHHIVPQESVLLLREFLDKMQKSTRFTIHERDPQEFLYILLKHIFCPEPYLKIRRSTSIEGEFFVQLFLDSHAHVMSDTESLLHAMFVEQGLVFVEYPTKLLLQVPRYGKHYKVLQRIIPKLEMDVTAICNLEQPCLVCGRGGRITCAKCYHEKSFVNGIKKPFFCDTCSRKWHNHNRRKHHKPCAKDCQYFSTGILQLLSVICIETSHYVCFTRITGSGKDEWVFFDSMAERPSDEFNRPEVKRCTDILNEWVYGDKDIINTTQRPPELACRFVQDVYLCIYIDEEGTMYR